jgi:hypothetical protein
MTLFAVALLAHGASQVSFSSLKKTVQRDLLKAERFQLCQQKADEYEKSERLLT